ncbi:MAG: hypothetical protein GY856_52610, partial [bacterium]|nr:hypothetical protein [bacterium]
MPGTPGRPRLDVEPPEVLSLALEPLAFGRALIRIEADEAVRLEVRYGAVGLEWTAVQPSFSPSPSLLLAGLDAAAAYTLTVVLTDPAGNA